MLIIDLCIECWQDDPKNRPDIQHVKARLAGMISGSNIVGKGNKYITDSNDGQQKSEGYGSLSHSSANLTASTSIDLMQAKLDELVKNFDNDN